MPGLVGCYYIDLCPFIISLCRNTRGSSKTHHKTQSRAFILFGMTCKRALGEPVGKSSPRSRISPAQRIAEVSHWATRFGCHLERGLRTTGNLPAQDIPTDFSINSFFGLNTRQRHHCTDRKVFKESRHELRLELKLYQVLAHFNINRNTTHGFKK